jgi:hypothetical protein
MTKFIIPYLVLFLIAPLVYADESLGLVQVGDASLTSSPQSILDFTVENRGFEKVLIALPEGWDIDETVDEYSYSTFKGYPVRESGLWRIYGLPYDRDSYLGAPEGIPYLTGKVWTGEGVTHRYGRVVPSNQLAWMLYPNEKLVVHIELSLSSEGVVDPTLIEEDYRWVRVTRWEQEFILSIDVSRGGFITAPWTMKDGKLTSAYPAVYCDENSPGCPGTIYWDDFTLQEQVETPEWDEWFTLKNSLTESLITTPQSIGQESSVSEDTTLVKRTIKPVWKIDPIPTPPSKIRYTYEWRREGEVEGGISFGDSYLDVPAWYAWF